MADYDPNRGRPVRSNPPLGTTILPLLAVAAIILGIVYIFTGGPEDARRILNPDNTGPPSGPVQKGPGPAKQP